MWDFFHECPPESLRCYRRCCTDAEAELMLISWLILDGKQKVVCRIHRLVFRNTKCFTCKSRERFNKSLKAKIKTNPDQISENKASAHSHSLLDDEVRGPSPHGLSTNKVWELGGLEIFSRGGSVCLHLPFLLSWVRTLRLKRLRAGR